MNGKCTAFSGSAFDCDASSVGLGDVFDDSQAESCSAKLSASGFIYAIESFKQAGQVAFLNSRSLVRYFNDNFRFRPSTANMHDAFRLAVFDGVIDEVYYSLFKRLASFIQ